MSMPAGCMCFLFYCFVVVVQSADFTVPIDKNGSYKLLIKNQPWLVSGPTFFQSGGMQYSTARGTLKMTGPPNTVKGMDTFGPWTSSQFQYSAGPSNIETEFRIYTDVNVAIFSQTYLNGANKTSVGNMNGVISGFPSFAPSPNPAELGFIGYQGLFSGWEKLRVERFEAKLKPALTAGLEGGPLVLFDKNDSVIIISSFNNFMSASFQYNATDSTTSYGVMGMVDTIPPYHNQEFIVFYSSKGINQAFKDWGCLMRKWYNRDYSAKEHDLSINYLGYWTDNGAYYYHATEPFMNYEKTMMLETLYAQSKGIPYKYIQFDDWFYPIAGTGYGATVTWDAMPSIFPNGLRAMYNFTQLPVHAHNRYWSSKTTYAKQNGGQFNFLMDGENSIPDDQEFWDYLFAVSKEWGLVVYEQDWMNQQVEKIKWLHTDLTLGDRWLKQMGRAGSKHGIFIQYCMTLPREALTSLEIPSVSQIRASTDYLLSTFQWKIGISSILIDALGLAPFKDNFWTKTDQPHNKYGKTEPNPPREAAVAILSTGPVGPSDKVGYSNSVLISQLVNSDGLLLKPSKPATAIDAQILQQAFGGNVGPIGEVWTTYSDIGLNRFGIIFASELNQSYSIGPDQARYGSKWTGSNIVYSTNRTSGKVLSGAKFSDSSPLILEGCDGFNMCLYYTSPVFSIGTKKYFFAGETSKFVPISPKRIQFISVSSADMVVIVLGAAGEVTTFSFCSTDQPTNCLSIKCVISGFSKATISLTKQSCQ